MDEYMSVSIVLMKKAIVINKHYLVTVSKFQKHMRKTNDREMLSISTLLSNIYLSWSQ